MQDIWSVYVKSKETVTKRMKKNSKYQLVSKLYFVIER